MSTSHEEQHSRHPTFMQYVMIAIFLFAVTIVEFVLIWEKAGIDTHLGASKVPLLIALSAIKFAIVIMFYMHLKFDSKLFTWIFLAGLALAFAVGIALLGIFVSIGGEPREFAQAHAVPYVHESEGEEHTQPGDHATEATEPGSGQVAMAGPLEIGVVGDALEFDTDSLTASGASEVVLTFGNSSTIYQHNWILVTADAKDEVAKEASLAGPDNDWVPPGDPRVLAQTTLLDPGETEEVRFTVAPGTYQFVCTFPGHAITMFGDFEVTP